jgi:hypothetical protein
MTSISQIINAWAKLQMSLHPVKVEWKSAIIITALIKFLTMLFSAYAAYTYFYQYIIHIVENQQLSTIFSIAVLVFLEAITAIFLGKVFKFFFRKRYRLSLFIFILVGALYTLSFVSSTNGLAKRQAAKTDNTRAIRQQYQEQLNVLALSQSKEILELDTLIANIQKNPIVWLNRKRKHLSLEQQNNILQLNRQKSDIRKNFEVKKEQLKTDFVDKINQNQEVMAKTANQYYQVMAIVIVIQFVVTGILIYLLYRVYLQENKQEILNERIKAVHDRIYNHATDSILKIYQKVISDFSHLSPKTKNLGKTEQKQTNTNIDTSTDTCLAQKSILKTPELLSEIKQDTESYRQYCIKHKFIVQAIINTVNVNQPFLSKQDIDRILPLLKDERHKSASLIRKVYKCMQLSEIQL